MKRTAIGMTVKAPTVEAPSINDGHMWTSGPFRIADWLDRGEMWVSARYLDEHTICSVGNRHALYPTADLTVAPRPTGAALETVTLAVGDEVELRSPGGAVLALWQLRYTREEFWLFPVETPPFGGFAPRHHPDTSPAELRNTYAFLTDLGILDGPAAAALIAAHCGVTAAA